MTLRKYIITLAMIAVTLAGWAAPVSIRAHLDSAHVLMGRVNTLHIEILQDRGTRGTLIESRLDTLQAYVEVLRRSAADTTALDNNREQITQTYTIQSFDSGLYVIPPLRYVVGKDTFMSKAMSLKVIPVRVDTTQTIIGIKPPEEVPFRLLDWLPDWISDYWWAWLLLLLLIAGGVYYYMRYYRHGRNPLRPERKRLPPYEEAIHNLQALKAKQLWQKGQEKEYFTGLTDILRMYIDRRFGINAVEMTSSEILRTLRQNGEAAGDQLAMVLEMADIVKFAAQKPLADDNEVAYQRALNFVEATKPVELPQPEADPERKGKEARR